MLGLGLFLPLVLTALTVSWHNRDVRDIGLALLFSWAVSNATAIWLPFDYRPIIYPVLEVVIALTAAGAWLTLHKPIAIVIVTAAMFSVAACVNYALESTPGYHDQYLFVLITNILFAIECILVGAWGISDAMARAGGLPRKFRRARHDLQSDAGPTEGTG